MWSIFKNFARENHTDEVVAGRFHVAQAVVYGLLILGYVSMIAYHLAAAGRHRRAADLLRAAGQGGAADERDQGC